MTTYLLSNSKLKIIFFVAFIFVPLSAFPQETIKVDIYEFTIGESKQSFISKYPKFQVDEYLDEDFPDDVAQYYLDDNTTEINIYVKFFEDNLFEVHIDDQFWSGLFSDFNPLNFGFTKIGEEKEFVNNQYPEVLTELFQKNDIYLNFCNGRFGFLRIFRKLK